MQLIKFFIVFVALNGRTSFSKILIEINKSNELAKLEDAAIYTLTNCHVDKDKTVVLVGDFPESFVKRLSSHRSFSLALVDHTRRVTDQTNYAVRINQDSVHKVQIVVVLASYIQLYQDLTLKLLRSKYHNSAASVLVLSWSPEKGYRGYNNKRFTVLVLHNSRLRQFLNVNVMCMNRTGEVVLIGVNPFKNEAPKPWKFVHTLRFRSGAEYYFVRKYQEPVDLCKNLDFDKTRDLGGTKIDVMFMQAKAFSSTEKLKAVRTHGWKYSIDQNQKLNFFNYFLTYVNASQNVEWTTMEVGSTKKYEGTHFRFPSTMLRGIHVSYTYPHSIERTFIITQFRGNKSQHQKILDIIDRYSWYGMYTVYLITLVFFKIFLHQPLVVAILNICRLTCNLGLTTLPPNVAAQIYLACLFIFVVTMQGIFVGNLAALLTYDIPVRQVDSITDLAELGYSVYAHKGHLKFFEDVAFKGRLIPLQKNELCWQYVTNESLSGCVAWGVEALDFAFDHNLHVSTGSVSTEYASNRIRWLWCLEERFNNFIRILHAGGIMTGLDTIVQEKRLLEFESTEVSNEPRIMTLNHLGFAFPILVIGLGFASIVFVIEIIIYRFRHRVTTTRAIVL